MKTYDVKEWKMVPVANEPGTSQMVYETLSKELSFQDAKVLYRAHRGNTFIVPHTVQPEIKNQVVKFKTVKKQYQHHN